MSKLKVDEIRQSTRSVSDSANITLASDGNVSLGGTLSAGTIGSSVTDSATTSTSITSASVTNLDLNPCFSASYNVYDFYLAGCSPDQTTGTNLEMYFLKSDGSVSTADVWMVIHVQFNSGGTQDLTSIIEDTNGKITPLADVDSDMSRGAFLKGTIFNPFSSTDHTSGHIQGGGRTEISGATSAFSARDLKFSQETLVSCTGLRFKWSSGLWATGATNAVGKLIVKGVR